MGSGEVHGRVEVWLRCTWFASGMTGRGQGAKGGVVGDKSSSILRFFYCHADLHWVTHLMMSTLV